MRILPPPTNLRLPTANIFFFVETEAGSLAVPRVTCYRLRWPRATPRARTESNQVTKCVCVFFLAPVSPHAVEGEA